MIVNIGTTLTIFHRQQKKQSCLSFRSHHFSLTSRLFRYDTPNKDYIFLEKPFCNFDDCKYILSTFWAAVEMADVFEVNKTRSESWIFFSKLIWTLLFDDNILENKYFLLDIHYEWNSEYLREIGKQWPESSPLFRN